MTKEECLGKIVMLDEGFLLDAYDFDNGVPPKTKRPYLVVELEKVALEKKDDEKQLFAIPMQTSVGYKDLDNSRFYTRLPRRLTAKMNCETALIYSQMIPITIKSYCSCSVSDNIRIVIEREIDKKTVDKVFSDLAVRYAKREGGYTRILKLDERRGDDALVVILELVEGDAK